MQGVSGLLIPTGRFSAELGSQGSDQHGRRNAGSEDLQRGLTHLRQLLGGIPMRHGSGAQL
jgi:hypothetical protein